MSIQTAKWIVILLIGAALPQPARAWQSPDELPAAPRVGDDDPAPQVLENPHTYTPESEAALSTLRIRRPVPAPAIVPVEEIIARPATIEPTASDRPDAHTVPTNKPTREPVVSTTAQPVFSNIHLKATAFKGVEPGVSTEEEIIALWGEPTAREEVGRRSLRAFAVAPFARVEVYLTEGVAQAIVVHFDTPAEAKQIMDRLQLTALSPVELVENQAGKVYGAMYPERGLALIYDEASDGTRIDHLQLLPLAAEPFLKRVRADRRQQWTNSLADLDVAAALSPQDDRIAWLKSEILTQQSEFRQAAMAIEEALASHPDSAQYQLSAANLIALAGNYADAIAATTAVHARDDVPALLKAHAARQLGDLYAQSPQHDYAKALQFHQQSIELALPLATGASRDVRAAAKRLLVNAHAGVASDIAQGRWQQKDRAARQWFDRADALAEEFINVENGPESLRFDLLCQRLAAYAWLDGKVDPIDEVAHLQQLAEQLREDYDDPTFARHIDWQFAKAMVDAIDIERARANPLKAMEYGRIAEATLAPLAACEWNSEQTQFQLSRMHFLLGAIQAAQLEDHAAAVKWFEKSIDDISRPEPDADLAKSARRGQWMVSMGISYWSVERQDEALRLTQLGVRLIEAAQAAGQAGPEALVVPYNNLAVMHKDLGNDEDARQFAALAAKVKEGVQR